jgi:hypothetical protein
MNKGILFLLLLITFSSNAQSLKDLLYSGKLKSDTGTLVKKTDDLNSKIDTSKKKPVEPQKTNVTGIVKDSSQNKISGQTSVAITNAVEVKDNNTVSKDNNKIWKVFMDSMIVTFKEEVLSSKKIKSGTYYILVDYEIGPEGQVTINNIYPSPENSHLEQEVKKRLILSAPQLNPVLSSTGKPRKVIKKYNFTLTKS